MKKLKFIKEIDQRWYIDLPDWTGSKEDLEMVAGADDILEYIASGNSEIYLYVSEDEFENSDKLELIRLATELNNGAYYELKTYKGIELNLDIWLCDVTKFVFGNFPKEIFISPITM